MDASTLQGSLIRDLSGFGNNGTLVAAPLLVNGRVGNALSFNGSTQYVSVADAASLDVSSGTWAFWINLTADLGGSGAAIMYKTDTGPSANGVLCIHIARQVIFGTRTATGAGQSEWDGPTIPTGEWHHFIFTWISGGATTGFYDGIQQFSGSTAAFSFSTQPLYIAQTGDGAPVFKTLDGLMDDVRVYNRPVTPAEAWRMFSDTSGNLGLIVPTRRIVGCTGKRPYLVNWI